MRILSFSCLFAVIASVISPGVHAQFVAFNDHAPGAGTSPNATTYDVFGAGVGAAGPLKDITTGATLPVTLTITITPSGVVPAAAQGSPAVGTPLYDAFNTYVDFQGTPNPSIELTSGGLVTYTFTGLNPNKRYRFMGSAVRGNGYTDRWTLFELDGVVSFSSAHTKNVLTNAVVPLISLNQAAINTGINNTPDTGDMVVWENIDPGSEGTFSVSCQQYTGPVPNGSSAGIKGYGMTGLRLEEMQTAGSPAAILIPPQSQTVQESQSATFTVTAIGNPPPTFQWFKNNIAVTGATNGSYVIPAVPFSDNGAVIKVVASNRANGVDYNITSNDAILTVTPDTTAPTLVQAQAVGFTQVKLVFSERVTAATATDLSNYSISGPNGPVAISGVSLDANENTVILNVDLLTEGLSYTISVSGIRDKSSAANLIAPTQSTFAALTYAPLDIGAVNIPGSVKPVGAGAYDVSGSGGDIAGTRDQFQFGYQQKIGDFDVRVRLADLTITDAYVKAGLMARETLQDSSRFAAIFASSAQLGDFFESRSSAGSAATMTGPISKFPANYPWAWLRMQRSSNDFTGYGSFDGKAWQKLGAITLAVTNQVYLGLAVTSGSSNALATAKFRDIGDVVNPTTFVYKPEHESIGPANRRTGIIFSEIMYHSKPRADGRSMDFVEIYNGEAIFIDMSGWKIAGGIDFTFPDGFKIGAGQFIVIASDPEAIQDSYGISGVLGPYQRVLSDKEDTLKLLNLSGAVRDELTYSSTPPWPTAAAGTGHSLVCKNPSYGEDDVRAWGPSELIGGSPGHDDPIAPNPWKGVLINEFLAVPSAGQSGFIELYNASNTGVDLSGCFITDSPSLNKFRIPDTTRVEARSWISFTAQELGFALNSGGGSIYLISADQSRVLDAITIEAQETGVSMGRAPDGDPNLRRLASATPGQLNAARRQENVVINEIMYNPITGDSDDEYVELYNRSATAIDIGGWRFTSGIDFTFAAGTKIPGNGY
ncbi:MAG TPA: lamin tail domain-containing protein, partial [Verrucomicrobiae bacterium]